MRPGLRGALRRRLPSGQIDGPVSIRALKRMLIFLSLFGNPVDAARVAGLISAGDAAIFGAAGAALLKFLGAAS